MFASLGNALFGGVHPLSMDLSVHARLLVALPVLLGGKRFADTRFARAMAYVNHTPLLPRDRRLLYEATLHRFVRLRDSWAGGVLVVAAACLSSAFELAAVRSRGTPSWELDPLGMPSLAGLWYYGVARPLLVAQVASWFWSLGLWTWLLAKLASVPLRPIAGHPDGVGGLDPILRAHRVFALLALALGASVGGTLATRVAYGSPPSHGAEGVAAFVAFATVALLSPLLFFVPLLVRTREAALVNHEAMAALVTERVQEHARDVPHLGLSDTFLSLLEAHANVERSLAVLRRTRVVPITTAYVALFAFAAAAPIALARALCTPLGALIRELATLVAI
jgi:hypothetical protein